MATASARRASARTLRRDGARRRGLATDVMHRVALDAREAGCTSATLQATNLGEKLYKALGYRKVSDMQLWERRR